jgi:hypothetical protein
LLLKILIGIPELRNDYLPLYSAEDPNLAIPGAVALFLKNILANNLTQFCVTLSDGKTRIE